MLTLEQFIIDNPLLTVEEQPVAYQSYVDAFNLAAQIEADRLAAELAEQQRLNTIASLKQRVEAVIKGDVGHPAIRAVLPDCNNFAYDYLQIELYGDLQSFVEQLEVAGLVANAKMEQDVVNAINQAFLYGSDFKVLRHLREKMLGIPTSMTDEEYHDLEVERQAKAKSIVR